MKCVSSRWVLLMLLPLAAQGCGGAGGRSASLPEQSVRKLLELEWSGNVEKSWEMLHPLWQRGRYASNLATYANEIERENKACDDSLRTILRMKTFFGDHLPGKGPAYQARLGKDEYEYSVVRVRIHYPWVEGYIGGETDYLYTMVRKKGRGAQWKVLEVIKILGYTDFFEW